MNPLLRWFLIPWWAMQRRLDLKMLWPQCKALADDLDQARSAFAVHAMHDACWIEYYGERRLLEVIGALE